MIFMKRRFLYVGAFAILYIALHTLVANMMFQRVEDGMMELYQAHLYLLSTSVAITVLLALVIMYEGRYHKSFFVIGMLIIATRLMDAIRFGLYPLETMEVNLISFWGGMFIFAFALGLFRDIIFRYRISIFFVIIGIATFIRFPIYYIDMWLYYYMKWGPVDSGLTLYYDGVMLINYIVVIMALFALDGIIHNNIEAKRYIK